MSEVEARDWIAKQVAQLSELPHRYAEEIAGLKKVSAALEAALAASAGVGATVPEWQNISTYPRDHSPRLTWSSEQGQAVAFLDVTWAWWSVPNGDGPMRHAPTRWRESPAHPALAPVPPATLAPVSPQPVAWRFRPKGSSDRWAYLTYGGDEASQMRKEQAANFDFEPMTLSDLFAAIAHPDAEAEQRGRLAGIEEAITRREALNVDALAQEIRRVDGTNTLGAGALAEALMPFLRNLSSQPK